MNLTQIKSSISKNIHCQGRIQKTKPLPYYVYILLCKDGSLYTGQTKNLPARMKRHKLGTASRYTRIHKPIKIIYLEHLKTRKDAIKREQEVKRLSHKKKLCLQNVGNEDLQKGIMFISQSSKRREGTN